MVEKVVYMSASHRKVLKTLRQIPAIASGMTGDNVAATAVQAMLVRIGVAALGRIKQAFIVKARGGTDETGLKWDKLSPKTVAYSRRHPGVLHPGRRRAPFKPSWMLTAKQRRRWWALYAVGGPAYAWRVVKAEGGKTLIGEYGDTPVDILRDTGLLLNSLSPGVASGSSPPQIPEQVFQLGRGEVIVGTSRRFAGSHHRGIPGRLTQRRLWPEPRDWTPNWWADLAEQAREGLVEIAIFMLGRAS